jgi:hypothetical protein
MVLGHQGVSGARPCPCCCTPRADFGKPAHHCSKESSLHHISSKRLALLQSLHQRSQSLGGDTVMSYYASGSITSGTREMVAEALVSNRLFVGLLADPSEVHALQCKNALIAGLRGYNLINRGWLHRMWWMKQVLDEWREF